jgi:competence protein ComEC
VGFQLSYLAVWSLVVFMQPIYQLLFLQNKILDFIWQMNAVTISAQILTLPISIYYFHQFPNLFLITNMVAVPLSSVIVGGRNITMYFLLLYCSCRMVRVLLEISYRPDEWICDEHG